MPAALELPLTHYTRQKPESEHAFRWQKACAVKVELVSTIKSKRTTRRLRITIKKLVTFRNHGSVIGEHKYGFEPLKLVIRLLLLRLPLGCIPSLQPMSSPKIT